MRIVATTTMASPYTLARYRRFVETFPEHELCLLEFGEVASEYPWLPSDVTMPFARMVLSSQPIELVRPTERRRLIGRALAALRPDVLVACGYGVPGMGAALQWARASSPPVPVVMLSDSAEADDQRVAWKERVKRHVISQCGAALVAGAPHRHYMRRLGMNDDSIFEGYDVIDNAYFAGEIQRAITTPTSPSLPSTSFFLASKRFLHKKNLLRLIEAFARYRANAGSELWDLVILGDGELRRVLETKIEELRLGNYVHLAGFLQYEELPRIYGSAGAFVHASTVEQWGLVVNEAMAAGLPVIVSDRCGCVSDLIQEGVNGYIFDPFNVDELASRMTRLASPDCNRAAMGNASREIISKWSLDTFANGLSKAVEASLQTRSPGPRWIDHVALQCLSWR